MQQYLDLIRTVLDEGEFRESRAGDTISIFGAHFEHDLSEGFPAITTKKLAFLTGMRELKWMLSGGNNLKQLLDMNVHIWDADAYRWYKANHPGDDISFEEYIEAVKNSNEEKPEIGDLGVPYGRTWRYWKNDDGEYIDQVANAIYLIKHNPNSRRILWHAWDVGRLNNMVLPPCHTLYQFYVSQDRKLSLHLYQRSGDLFLGVPVNISNCALLTHLIAEHCGLDVGKIRISFGDLHLYQNHLSQAIKQLRNKPFELPELIIRQDLRILDDISDFETSSISLLGYQHHGTIKAPLSVGDGK